MTDFITEENSLLILCNECEDCIKQNLFSLLSSKIEEIQANLSDIKSDLIANKVCKIFYSVSFTYYDQNQLKDSENLLKSAEKLLIFNIDTFLISQIFLLHGNIL